MNRHDGQVWFFSDPHWYHGNIIKYCSRPFMDKAELDIIENGTDEEIRKLRISSQSVERMNAALISNINACVDHSDTVWCLGDFVFGRDKVRQAKKILDRIVCKRISLIYGNHDKLAIGPLFSFASHLATVKVRDRGDRQDIVLCHYPMRSWNEQHRGAWHLYGHHHGNPPPGAETLKNLLSFDAGVDCHNFKPLNYDDIKRKMDKIDFVPQFRHAKDDKGRGK